MQCGEGGVYGSILVVPLRLLWLAPRTKAARRIKAQPAAVLWHDQVFVCSDQGGDERQSRVGISEATVTREWRAARAWLKRRLAAEDGP